jgi:hypothetical protein
MGDCRNQGFTGFAKYGDACVIVVADKTLGHYGFSLSGNGTRRISMSFGTTAGICSLSFSAAWT